MASLEHITPGAIVIDESGVGEKLCAIIASQVFLDERSARVMMCCTYFDGEPAHVRSSSWWLTRPATLTVMGSPTEDADGSGTV